LDLSFIIATYQPQSELRKCLDSLYTALDATSSPLTFETIIVDNSEREVDWSRIRNQFSNLTLIENSTNLGLSRANNLGAKQALGRVLVFLNPDVIIHSGSIETLLADLEQHPQAGILAPKVLNPDGTLQYSCRRYPTVWSGLFNRYSFLSNLMPSNRHTVHYLMKDYDHETPRDVEWVSGCFMMIRKEMFFQVGMFDEQFFLFIEDIDLCKRVHEAGFQVMYQPNAVITHQIQSSNGKLPSRIIIKRHLGMSYYQKKYMPFNRFVHMVLDAGIMLRCCGQLIFNRLK